MLCVRPSLASFTARRISWLFVSRRQRRGAAAAEFAMLAPFLVFLLLGMFEVARGIMVKQILNDAARKACRTGITQSKANSDITKDINDILNDNSIPPSDATINIYVNNTSADVSSASRNDKITVQVSVPIGDVYWVSTFFLTKSTVDSDYVSMMKQ
jgi:Flp pilus assembly protein TadG